MIDPEERRADPRHPIGETGSVALDEHTSIGCLIHDLSLGGVRITLPDANCIPDIFLLTASCLGAVTVCSVVWRTDEMIGAAFS